MRHRITVLLLIFQVLSHESFVMAGEVSSYTAMQDDLAALIADFNEAVDKVRLVFLPSPA